MLAPWQALAAEVGVALPEAGALPQAPCQARYHALGDALDRLALELYRRRHPRAGEAWQRARLCWALARKAPPP